MRFYHSFLVAAVITIISSAAWAEGIKMLPPSDFDGDTCAGTKIGILQWDGANPIRCVPNFTGDKNGNIGIKTATPDASLHIMSGAGGGPDRTLWLQAKERAGTFGNNSPGVLFLNSLGRQEAGVGLAGFPGAWGLYNQTRDLGLYSLYGNVNLGTSPDGVLSNVLARVTVTPSGNVGIGTTTPQVRLDVNGEVRLANSSVACSAANEGAIRYDSATKTFTGCDGTAWASLGKGKLKTQQVYCVGTYEGMYNDYGCKATCPAGTQVTGGGFQWGAVISEWGRNMWQDGNGYHCLVNIDKCSSGAPSCGVGCYATCASIE